MPQILEVHRLIQAHRAAIKSIDDIDTTFWNMRKEMEAYEQKKNIAQTVGTSTAALGTVGVLTGIGLAFFTGGTSLLLTYGSLAATVGGAGVNAVTSIVDIFESKGFYKRINQQLDHYTNTLQNLGQLWTELNQLVEELQKNFNLDNNTALYVALKLKVDVAKVAGVVNQSLNATRMFQAAATINTLKTLGTVTRTATGGTKFVFSSLETAASLSARQMAALKDVLKSDVMLFTQTAGRALMQGALAVFSVVVTLWEIKTLVDDWRGNHPTIQAVDKVRNELKKKMESIQDIINNLEAIM